MTTAPAHKPTDKRVPNGRYVCTCGAIYPCLAAHERVLRIMRKPGAS